MHTIGELLKVSCRCHNLNDADSYLCLLFLTQCMLCFRVCRKSTLINDAKNDLRGKGVTVD